ncbi:hypothetical protein [Bradyrhizobium sp. Bra78]|uniref:hypothetical protein n=1 Tax=Bradyrhizobium sp. Bra78 TaxID=2926010 RepID=UPI0021C82C77|nr:hypothetical protein [Bradyrhizobium sp. Bra78]
MTWSARFEEPIALPGGHTLVTLLDVGDYIAALSPALQRRPEWQAAAEALLLVAERGGPTMFARIGVMRALNAGKPPTAQQRRRKLAKSYRLIR